MIYICENKINMKNKYKTAKAEGVKFKFKLHLYILIKVYQIHCDIIIHLYGGGVSRIIYVLPIIIIIITIIKK